MAHHGLTKLCKTGFCQSFKAIFPVRKEAGEDTREFIEHIRRKLTFDLGIYSFKSIGKFNIETAGLPENFASGVAVLQIATDIQKLLWLRLGERCYDVEIKLGESRRYGPGEDELLEYKDCSHVTGEMIQRALPKFSERKSQTLISRAFADGVAPRVPAICHEIRMQSFEHPMLRLHIRCGAGFRTTNFVYELASELGTVGYPTRMHRVSQGPFTYEDALPSYAISWENCTKVAEKYADRLRSHNYEMRKSFSEEDIKPFLTEKRMLKLFWNPKRKTIAGSENAPADSCENV